MWKSEIKHQYWVAKKSVQRKLGAKEDEHIISSDAGLDKKIALFKFTSETTTELHKILSQFEERMRALSAEECRFGQFLKEAGKSDKSSGEALVATGKAITFSGQQRMKVRVTLSRMHHVVEVFRNRAINDSFATIKAMEKRRTGYRATLSWMKSLSATLDPDTGMGLDNFRAAQSYVRASKKKFDRSSAVVVAKIDLLVAAGYSMYSRTLLPYMTELLQFSKISANFFKSSAFDIRINEHYDFCVLKHLFQKKSMVSSKQNGPNNEVNVDQGLEDEESNNKSALHSNAVVKSTKNEEQTISPLLLGIETLEKPDDFDLSKATVEHSRKGIHSWTELFAEFDPLDDLEALGLQVASENTVIA